MAQLTDTLEDTTRVSSTFKPQLVKADEKHPPRWLLVAPVMLLALAVATAWWLYARQFESTDDAQIEGHLNPISARVSGNVVYINPAVENNHYVEAGTLLMQLDPNDYQAALEHAQADLLKREASVRSAGVRVPIVDADAFSRLRAAEAARDEATAAVDAEEANLAAAQHKVDQDQAISLRAERDRVRYHALVEKREISRSEYDARETEALSAAQALAADRALVATAEKRIVEARSKVAEKEAEVGARRTAPEQVTEAQAQYQSNVGDAALAKADVRTAELNLRYTKIYAPVSGVIGRKTAEVGQHIQPGQSLLAIVPLDDIWITANFKETQLKLMRPGQHVRVHVDAFDRDYTGTVDDLPGAAGTLFSLLPPENASGNFVKVIQRLPVRIRFDTGQDGQHALRPGMSVEPAVKVR
jgi:membrane fusion protein (multidrug efflux system)